jgi:hypothetical protein
MGRGEKVLRKMGSGGVFILSIVIGEIFWAWLLIFTGNNYLAIILSVVAVLGVPYFITFRIRQQTGRWWFVTVKGRFLEPPRWNTATAGFWERVECPHQVTFEVN